MGEAELVKAFGALFAIMNPFVNLPIFLALTSGLSAAEQRRFALRVVTLSAVMCALVIVGGRSVLSLFGISVDTIRIAGGLVLCQIAWSMLNGGAIRAHHGSAGESDHMAQLTALAFYPITFPILVGPGTIATLILYASHGNDENRLVLGGIVVVLLAMVFAVFAFAAAIGSVLGASLRMIVTRLMGMILLAIGVDMVLAGIAARFSLG